MLTKLTKLTTKYLKQRYKLLLSHGTIYLTMSIKRSIMLIKGGKLRPVYVAQNPEIGNLCLNLKTIGETL